MAQNEFLYLPLLKTNKLVCENGGDHMEDEVGVWEADRGTPAN